MNFPLDLVLADPAYWSNAYLKIESLRPGIMVHTTILNFYLLKEWHIKVQFKHTSDWPCYYLNRTLVTRILSGPVSREAICQGLLVKHKESHPLHPVLFLCTDISGRQLCIVFDYSRGKVFAFGNNLMEQVYTDWTSWKGPDLWAAVGAALGFGIDNLHPIAMEMDWLNVSGRVSYRFTY